MTFRPIADRILVSPIKEEEKQTKEGIYIPHVGSVTPIRGQVIAIGNGVKNENGMVTPIEVNPGDIVFYSKYGGTEITMEGESFLVIRESDILGVVNDGSS